MRPPLPALLRPYSAGTETAQRHADQGTQHQKRIKMEEVRASLWGKPSKSYSPDVEETQRGLYKGLTAILKMHRTPQHESRSCKEKHTSSL